MSNRRRGGSSGWSAHRRKAPSALRHHPSILIGVFVAAMLAAVAASSSPFVTTAVASEALQTRLTELTRYASGLVITGESPPATGSLGSAVRQQQDRVVAARRFAAGVRHLGSPVLTLETAPSQAVQVTGPQGQDSVRLMSRTGFLAHVRVIAKTGGGGVWVSDITATATGTRPGATLNMVAPIVGRNHSAVVRLRVKGIYQALARSPMTPYWVNLEQDFFPPSPDASVPPTYVLMGQAQLLHALSSSRVKAVSGMEEWPIGPGGITLPAARKLARPYR